MAALAELTRTLADEGVRHLFINPGTAAPVQEALAAARAAAGRRRPPRGYHGAAAVIPGSRLRLRNESLP
jgi:hypothetical protein